MRLSFFILIFFALLGTYEAQAASVDAREIARLNNCAPKKIDVYQQTLGSSAKTVYRVECNIPKAKDESAAPAADALLVQCSGSLCEMIRPVTSENK